MRVTLKQGDLLLEVDPAAGGSVSLFKHRELHVLRPAPDRCGPAFDPLQYSAFPMAPFVGRIHNGRSIVNGREITLHANLPPEPHAIHGHGWQAAWHVEHRDNDSVILAYVHDADAWPWAYEARQVFKLDGDLLRVDLSVTNHSDSAMPAGLGWHPYFYRKDARLIVSTTHEWEPDANTGDNQPHPVSPANDLSSGARVEALNLDTAFSVARSEIELTWPTHSVTLKSDPVFSHATIFVPPGADFFCAEPITHAPNAVNSQLPTSVSGLRWLAPSETLSGTITLSVKH